MAKSHKQQKAGGEVLRNAKEITQIEQYWHVLGRAKPRKPPKEYNYVEELAHLQLELIELQEWVHMHGLAAAAIDQLQAAEDVETVLRTRNLLV